MIRVKIDLVPFGEESKSRQIAEMVIANDGTGDMDVANYIGAFKTERDDSFTFTRLKSYERSNGIMELLQLMLEAGLLEQHSPETEQDNNLISRLTI